MSQGTMLLRTLGWQGARALSLLFRRCWRSHVPCILRVYEVPVYFLVKTLALCVVRFDLQKCAQSMTTRSLHSV